MQNKAHLKKVLAVDDNPRILLLLEKLIHFYFPDAEFFKAESGTKGLSMAVEKQPNVILLDIMMPDPDGYEICEQIKANEKTWDIPVVFLSSIENNLENRLKARKAGADAFLAQPVDNWELVLQIEAMFKINTANIKNRNEKKYLSEQLDKHSKKLKDELARRKEAEKALIESESRYRLLVESQNDLVVKFDSNHKMVYVNSNFFKCFGLDKSEIIGKKFLPFIHENDLETVTESFAELKVSPHQSYHEDRIKTVDGWKWFGWSKRALFNDKNEIVEVVSVGRDINKRKRTEKQLKKTENELRELNATKDKFFSIIAHDLKSPFSGILGLSQLIHDLCEKEQYDNLTHLSELLKKAANQSYDLLNNLLEWSRTQSGRKKFEPSILNLHNVFTDTINLVMLGAREKNLKIHLNCEEDIALNADPDMLYTILRNLLSNAVKYSYNGGEINMSAIKQNDQILVSVEDEGMGIAPNLQDKLFVIGELVVTAGTNKETGTGLGLILCKEFVEIHGGEIWLESEKDNGATLKFTLPLIS